MGITRNLLCRVRRHSGPGDTRRDQSLNRKSFKQQPNRPALATFLVVGVTLLASAMGPSAGVDAAPNDFRPKMPVAVTDLTIQDTLPEAANASGLYSYKITGQVLLGSNSCFAGDNQAVVKQRFENGNLYLWLAVEGSPRDPNIACLQVYDPVYGTFAVEISGERSDVGEIYLVGTGGNGQEITLRTAALLQPEELVMSNLGLTPGRAGIAPNATVFNVKADVTAGSNGCLAGMYDLSLKTKVVGRELHVYAVRTRRPETLGTVCPAVYQPVTKVISELVVADRNEVDSIVLKHVGARGNDLRRGLIGR